MSTQTTNYGLIKPDVTEFYDVNVMNDNFDIIDGELKKSADHITNKSNPHSTTASQVGLGNVPNVATNDQTPTYTAASSNTALVSGEKLSVAFGKIAKAVTSLISHLGDTVGHITSAERTKWNAKLDATGTAANAVKLDGKDITNFVYCPLQYGTNVFGTLDLNQWLRTGIYGIQQGSTPLPTDADGWGSIHVSTAMSGRIMQVAWFWNQAGNPLWKRISNSTGSTWSEWVKINDGGDADTLDGYHASNFLKTSASVPVVITTDGTTAPTDTTALWVY